MNTTIPIHEVEKSSPSTPKLDRKTTMTQRTRLHRQAPKIAALLMVLLICLAAYPVYSLFFVATNDAQIDGHILPVNSRINGTITWVNPQAEDTRTVQAGSVLIRLDPDDYTPAVDRLQGQVQAEQSQMASAQLNVAVTRPTAESRLQGAKASLAEAEEDLNQSRADIQSKEAHLNQARANADFAEADRERYEALVKTHEISKSEYDQRATQAITAREQVAIAQAELRAAQKKTAALRERLSQREAEVKAANVVPQSIDTAHAKVTQLDGELKESLAQLREAKLNLGYTTILAPSEGIVGQRQVEVGQHVQPGQLLLTVSPSHDLWVTAYFKETQMRRMRIGQAATIHIDGYGSKLRGHVESIGGATGAKYSVLPPENSTGNYVKVVQRIPVRFHIDQLPSPQQPLIPGMSVEVTVRLL
jgi:membrane fusion protein (multidrug efflux system)